MKIIIAGAGEVGIHLAKLLSYESQEITLIDTNKSSLMYADTHLDIKVLRGDATSIQVLKDARVEQSDLFIAVTSSETTNITVCVLAKQLGAKRTIARISNTEFIKFKDEVGFTKFGIDELISPEALAAEEIKLLLDRSAFNDSYSFENGALTVFGIELSRTAAFVGKTVSEAELLLPNVHFIPIAIKRFGTQYTLIPNDNTQYKEGDYVVFTTSKGGDDELCKLTGKAAAHIKNVMVLGGSKIGFKTARDLSANNINVKLIEKDIKRARDLAEDLPKVLVVNADGRNVDLLVEENLKDMDAFISVTGNSEINIMSSLVAKSKQVKKTIALVENVDYFELSQSIGIDTLINKKLLAANAIFRHIRRGDVLASTKLNNMNAELLEFAVNANSKITNTRIIDIKLPHSAILGGVVREGKGYVAKGNFKIEQGDKVVVCCLPRSIKEVEKLFL